MYNWEKLSGMTNGAADVRKNSTTTIGLNGLSWFFIKGKV